MDAGLFGAVYHGDGKEKAEMTLTEKNRKIIFYIILGLATVMLFAYVCLTPYMSDDYFYMFQARKATSFWDLIKQQYGEYLSNSGRIIGQFNIRLMLLSDKWIFNLLNSGMFAALVLLMYANVRRKKKYDLFVLLLIVVFLWRYGVSFGQTMLWICGACNYLWGSVIILGFVTFFRHFLEKADEVKRGGALAVATFFFGMAAGWCNENSSGGGLVLILLFGAGFFLDRKAEGKKALYPFMVTAVLGMLTGLCGMVLAPGVRSRSQEMGDEVYTGLVGLLSRVYKITVTVRELFFELFVILVIALVILALRQKLKGFHKIRKNESLLFVVAAAATAYALILIPTPTDRAFFGAGIFLMIGVIQVVTDCAWETEFSVQVARYALVSVLCVWLFFTYMENLVNLARIYREETERVEMIKADRADPHGDGIVVVPKLREAFANPYSNMHDSDLTEDKEYWINLFYEIFYDVGNITAIDRDEWEEKYADTFGQPK